MRLLFALACLAPCAVTAQVRPVSAAAPAAAAVPRRTITPAVPVHLLPPAGRCRIWLDSVPASRQPAPTDCATALRQKPANGVVLYGPATEDEGRGFDREPEERPAPAKAGGKRPPDRPEARHP